MSLSFTIVSWIVFSHSERKFLTVDVISGIQRRGVFWQCCTNWPLAVLLQKEKWFTWKSLLWWQHLWNLSPLKRVHKVQEREIEKEREKNERKKERKKKEKKAERVHKDDGKATFGVPSMDWSDSQNKATLALWQQNKDTTTFQKATSDHHESRNERQFFGPKETRYIHAERNKEVIHRFQFSGFCHICLQRLNRYSHENVARNNGGLKVGIYGAVTVSL